ncbi:MAG TPA: hypothetical protein VK593_04910, partial [Edaphobacter sp.]|nr:hypothetical protein [Edaphobacter sp.]
MKSSAVALRRRSRSRAVLLVRTRSTVAGTAVAVERFVDRRAWLLWALVEGAAFPADLFGFFLAAETVETAAALCATGRAVRATATAAEAGNRDARAMKAVMETFVRILQYQISEGAERQSIFYPSERPPRM